jgi:hypothetical protein
VISSRGVQVRSPVRAPSFRASASAPPDERRAPRGGDPEHEVARIDLRPAHLVAAVVLLVLGALDGLDERARSPRR